MAETIDLQEKTERFILIGVSLQESDDTKRSLEELEELLKTAGGEAVTKVIQNREKIHSATYIGKGKIEEVRNLADELLAVGVICDDELSPVQFKNLEDTLHLKIMDRTMLILDIFAKRASTKEGKIQVELAQLRYRASRLAGSGSYFSRLGGGIGTRGPGEKKLEVDRRLLKNRIAQLKKELEQIRKVRETTRAQRSKSGILVAAIVGYTNAGKSTLLNRLTKAGVLEEDKLFATLDPTTRNLKLESGQEILLTDTVGFIRKLPHHLIDAFKSTLEEAKYADIILHVVDSSNAEADTQMHVVYSTLKQLGVQDKPIITVFNKIDKVSENPVIKDFRADRTVRISAVQGNGVEELLQIVEEILREQKILIEHTFYYKDAGKIQTIRKYGQLLSEEYKEEGIYIKAYVSRDVYQKLLGRA